MMALWIIVIIILVYGIIAIHDIPASIARKRNHPHVEAIETAGWVSLFMLHVIWPILWIWASYIPPAEKGERCAEGNEEDHELLLQTIDELKATVDTLQKRLDAIESKGV
ncbi:hypothetical protein AS592_11495 [Sulfurovum riftiae]|uniref:GTPase n=2 Tax=Sulfurovum riftiae TaxID=1630136 RepID=A0A151CJT3_9BACT|nr:hypothetical protein AS592_11495 [Sulfurovum riftiae]